jgi:hypothetical protein
MQSSAPAKLQITFTQILTQSDQLHSKMQQLEAAVAQNDLQHVADTASQVPFQVSSLQPQSPYSACQCRLLLSALDNLPSLHLLRARIDEATLSDPPTLLLLLLLMLLLLLLLLLTFLLRTQPPLLLNSWLLLTTITTSSCSPPSRHARPCWQRSESCMRFGRRRRWQSCGRRPLQNQVTV